MAKFTSQESQPLHLENTVNSFAKHDLKLPQAFKTFRSMMENEYIGAGVGLTQNLINKLDYHLKCDDDCTDQQKRLVKKLNTSLDNLVGMDKTQFLNYVLSMLPYGHSMFEIVMEKDGNDFVFETFSPIHPINVKKYVYSRNQLEKLELTSADNDGQLIQNTAQQEDLNGEKVLMFKLNADLDNPLGRSVLSRCYMPYKKLEIVGEYELIGIAKNLSGVLKVKAPAEYINDYLNNPASENAAYMEDLISQAELLHGGKSCVGVVASDTNQNGVSLFDISTIGNSDGNDMDTNAIIKRLEASILTTLYTDILLLGQGGSGSFALSDSKTTLLTLVIESILKAISRGFEHAVKVAHQLNNVPQKGKVYLEFEGIEALDFDAYTRGMQRLVDAGILSPDDKLEKTVRERAKLGERDESTTRDMSDKKVTDQNERDEKEK